MPEPVNLWLLAAFTLAVIHWIARACGWMHISILTKLPVMAALIFWSLSFGGWSGNLRWMGLGLIFSLVGDGLLLLPGKFFLAGLFSFLMAHLSYIVWFCLPTPALDPRLMPFVFLLISGGYLYFHHVLQILKFSIFRQRFVVPIILYGFILCTMTLCACQTLFRPDWPVFAAAFSTAGGFFFLLSDSLLAYNRFVRSLPGGKTLEMVLYHLAQAAIITGALLK